MQAQQKKKHTTLLAHRSIHIRKNAVAVDGVAYRYTHTHTAHTVNRAIHAAALHKHTQRFYYMDHPPPKWESKKKKEEF